jgi:threonine-phosphate decarboxylase
VVCIEEVKMFAQGLHGGEVIRAAHELHCSPDELIDFSSNINPAGLPSRARAALLSALQDPITLRRYPDEHRHPLQNLLVRRFSVPTESVILGAGASALIMCTVRAIRPQTCLIFTPAFREYRRACEAVGSHCIAEPLSPEYQFRLEVSHVVRALDHYRPELLILNNPHNPSGALMSSAQLRAVVRAAETAGTIVLLDEAFIDYAEDHQLTSEAATSSNIICIRSFTKFYGCPALRIGFAVTSPEMIRRIQQQTPAWPVGSLEMDTLQHAVADDEYRGRTIEQNQEQRELLRSGLLQFGLDVYPSQANFLLARLPSDWPDSSQLRSILLHRDRILIRDCSTFETMESARFIRVAVLGSQETDHLNSALKAIPKNSRL